MKPIGALAIVSHTWLSARARIYSEVALGVRRANRATQVREGKKQERDEGDVETSALRGEVALAVISKVGLPHLVPTAVELIIEELTKYI